MSRVRHPVVPVCWMVLSIGFALLFPAPAAGDAVGDIEVAAKDARRKAVSLSERYLGGKGFRGKHHAEERFIDGENYYRLKDYQRAAIIFMDVVDSYPNHVLYGDALFYLGDALFLSRDYFGAREWFEKLLTMEDQKKNERFRIRAVGRLVEVAIHLDDYEGVEKHLEMLGQAPVPEALYVKGKYYYFQKDYERAKQEFLKVSGEVALQLKAAYFTGVALIRQERYDDAIKVFSESASRFQISTREEKELVDLLTLGQGRLLYERELLEEAAEVYRKIDRYSPWYDTSLYESAYVQIRSGDFRSAERILEVLTLSMPDSRYIPNAKLLRGNLLLRAGRYEEAEMVFGETVKEFTPVRDRMDEVVQMSENTTQFFESLMSRSLDTLNLAGVMPSEVVKWLAEEPAVNRAFSVSGDLGTAREYALETERLLSTIEVVVYGPSPVNAVPALRAGKRRSQVLRHQLAVMMNELMGLAEGVLRNDATMGRTAKQRKGLAPKVLALPTSEEAFQQREEKSQEVYGRMGQELSRNAVRVDRLDATIVALERFVSDPKYIHGVPPETIRGLRDELSRHRAAVAGMRSEMTAIRQDVERARYQVGVGDATDRADAELLAGLREIFRAEHKILASKSGKKMRRMGAVFSLLLAVEGDLAGLSRQIDEEAGQKITEIRQKVVAERERLRMYQADLAVLNREAEEVVGGVALENFSAVRRRFHQLIIKADLGIIDIAWMRKEDHKNRGTELTKRRLAEIQRLAEEFGEVRGAELPTD